MSASRTKQITTGIISVLIVLMLFAIFVLVYDSQQEELTYLIDQNNSCEWQDGVIVSSTEAELDVVTVTVDPDEEAKYLLNAEASSTCTASLGSDAGAYDTTLNREYQRLQDQ